LDQFGPVDRGVAVKDLLEHLGVAGQRLVLREALADRGHGGHLVEFPAAALGFGLPVVTEQERTLSGPSPEDRLSS